MNDNELIICVNFKIYISILKIKIIIKIIKNF